MEISLDSLRYRALENWDKHHASISSAALVATAATIAAVVSPYFPAIGIGVAIAAVSFSIFQTLRPIKEPDTPSASSPGIQRVSKLEQIGSCIVAPIIVICVLPFMACYIIYKGINRREDWWKPTIPRCMT